MQLYAVEAEVYVYADHPQEAEALAQDLLRPVSRHKLVERVAVGLSREAEPIEME